MSVAVLTILLSAPDQWPAVADRLRAEMFPPGEAEVFQAYAELAREGKKPDPVMVSEAIPTDHPAQEVLQRAVQGFASFHSLDGHIEALREKHRGRLARNIGQELAQGLDPDEAARKLVELSADTIRSKTVEELKSPFWNELVNHAETGFAGLSTGLRDLDSVLGGLRPGNLCIIAGRPGMGKTAMAMNIAQHQSCPTAVFSLEMSELELVGRMVATLGVDYERITTPRKHQDFEPITQALARLPKTMHICDKGGQTIDEIEAESYRLKQAHGIGLVAVDYLQIVRAKGEREYDVVSAVSRRLKAMAKRLELPVVGVAQLNRSVETRGGPPRPRISDLRESGQIEQDADQILFTYRPSYYERDGDDEIIVAKNRAGHTGSVSVLWQGRHQRFVNLSARAAA